MVEKQLFFIPASSLTCLPRRLVHKLFQFPSFHQLVQMIMQGFTVFDGVSSVLMVMEIKVLNALKWVFSHLIRPFEIRRILYFLKDLVLQLLEHQPNYLRVSP